MGHYSLQTARRTTSQRVDNIEKIQEEKIIIVLKEEVSKRGKTKSVKTKGATFNSTSLEMADNKEGKLKN